MNNKYSSNDHMARNGRSVTFIHIEGHRTACSLFNTMCKKQRAADVVEKPG